jgi:hypothetical protein
LLDYFRIYVFLCGEVEPSPLLLRPLIGLLYQAWMVMDDNECGAVSGMTGRGNPGTQRKPALGILCPPHIPHDMARAGTRDSAVGSQ